MLNGYVTNPNPTPTLTPTPTLIPNPNRNPNSNPNQINKKIQKETTLKTDQMTLRQFGRWKLVKTVSILVVKLSHNLSHQPKYNILELEIRRVIITGEYYDLYVVYRYKLL